MDALPWANLESEMKNYPVENYEEGKIYLHVEHNEDGSYKGVFDQDGRSVFGVRTVGVAYDYQGPTEISVKFLPAVKK